jgi:aminopeptidase N
VTTQHRHATIHRSDYTPYGFSVDSTWLRFELGEETTLVTSRLELRAREGHTGPLILDGHRFVLRSLAIDGRPLASGDYLATDENLTIPNVPSCFTLETVTELKPQDNTFLEGLYRSGGMFCTQCEAEGFRSITWYPDHPDVLSVFTTTIVADRERYPVLLSNGNLIETGHLPEGRHFATWHDPFPKPSYLFALVAGNLVRLAERFTTCSGREVALELYLQEANRHKGEHALRSLEKAMAWDERVFGREYDLDRYMIVAVDDFNMGAMENKGLNVFNSRYVLATPESATDEDFQAIEEVIGHEYFHNWSGNRVTCRDWFQLSLKEGLTVFRDQEFSADMQSRGVKRINDVRYLRTAQFPEDGGPMAHPVRPDSYMEINNFYTHTVYNKGAEIIRMLHTLLGSQRFRQGLDLYFERYDGQAVTIEDFVQAMADAGERDLGQFTRWYSQAGTPQLTVSSDYDPTAGTFSLTVRQSCPPTPGQSDKLPFHLPLVMGLLDRTTGRELPVTLEGEAVPGPTSRLLELNEQEHIFRFTGLSSEPLPALLRGFSAPVKLDYPYRHDDLVLLAGHERDPFCRWEAGQRLAGEIILDLAGAWQAGRELTLDDAFVEAYRLTLTSDEADRAFLAEALTLPSEKYLAELIPVADPDAIHSARQFVIRTLAARLRDDFLAVREHCRKTVPYAVDDGRAGERRLANLCLSYLMSLAEQPLIELCCNQYYNSDNMTDSIGALTPLASCDCPERREILEQFYDCWQHDRNVVDKWFTLQALSNLPGTIEEVRRLLEHPAFELANPNRFRSLVSAFSQNQVRFHAVDGSGYLLLTDQLIRLIPLNPQVSARLLAPLTTWRRYDATRQGLMRAELQRIRELENLPRDVFEVVDKSLRES